MTCEMCNKEHSSEYGSGRFCSCKCARGFSSKEKRLEINKAVSSKLKGRKIPEENRINGAYTFTPEQRAKGLVNSKIATAIYQKNLKWEDCGYREKRKRLLEEQSGRCYICKIEEWQGEKIGLELHHIDGKHKNNNKENIQLLCPNCHSQTKTDRFCGRNHTEESKKKISEYNKNRK